MGAITTAILVGAAVVGAGATAVSAQQGMESSRRAGTRAKSLIAQEGKRQAKQESLIAAQEAQTAKQVGGRLRATAGRRSGRRSLIQGDETGVSQLGQQQQLG